MGDRFVYGYWCGQLSTVDIMNYDTEEVVLVV